MNTRELLNRKIKTEKLENKKQKQKLLGTHKMVLECYQNLKIQV